MQGRKYDEPTKLHACMLAFCCMLSVPGEESALAIEFAFPPAGIVAIDYRYHIAHLETCKQTTSNKEKSK